LFIYICIYLHSHIYIYIHIHIHVYVYIYMYLDAYIYNSTCKFVSNHIFTSRTCARRVAEVSRFKKCNSIGSKDKVCL